MEPWSHGAAGVEVKADNSAITAIYSTYVYTPPPPRMETTTRPGIPNGTVCQILYKDKKLRGARCVSCWRAKDGRGDMRGVGGTS